MYVLLGTLGHLDHEPRFLRDMLAKVTRPDDLLLLDADLLLPGESDLQPLIGKVPVDDTALSDWLFEPFLHAATPAPHRARTAARRKSDSIPDCQTTSIIATVETRGMLPRQFSRLRQRRYRLSSLRTVLAQSGFVTLGTELWQDPQHGTTALLCVSAATVPKALHRGPSHTAAGHAFTKTRAGRFRRRSSPGLADSARSDRAHAKALASHPS